MTSPGRASAPAPQLERLGEEILLMMAVGIVRELFGDAKADRYRACPPPRDRLIRLIRQNDPGAR